MFYFDVF